MGGWPWHWSLLATSIEEYINFWPWHWVLLVTSIEEYINGWPWHWLLLATLTENYISLGLYKCHVNDHPSNDLDIDNINRRVYQRLTLTLVIISNINRKLYLTWLYKCHVNDHPSNNLPVTFLIHHLVLSVIYHAWN